MESVRGEPGTVVIVDDDRETLESLALLAQAEIPEVQVLVARSPPEALALLEQHRVTGIVTDLHMPGMDGLELLTEVHRRSPETKLALTTGSAGEEFEEEAKGVPLDAVVLKPFTAESFVGLVRQMAGIRKSPARAPPRGRGGWTR